MLLVATSCTLVYYHLGLAMKRVRQKSASQPLLKLAIYGAFGFALFRLFGHSVLAPLLADAFTLDAALAAQKLALPLRAVALVHAAPRAASATRPEAAYLALQGAAVGLKALALAGDVAALVAGDAFADDGGARLLADHRPASAALSGLALVALAYGLRNDKRSLALLLAATVASAPPALEAAANAGLDPGDLLGHATSVQLALLFATMTLCGTPLLMFSGLLLNALFRVHGVDLGQ